MTFKCDPDRSCAIADLSAAYANATQSARRGIALVNRRDVLVQDEISSQEPCESWWFAHTAASVSFDAAHHVATLKQGGKTVYVTLLEPQGAVFQLLDAAPLETSPRVNGQADESQGPHPVHKLAIHVAGQTKSQIAVLVSPTKQATSAIRPLNQW